MVDIWTKPGKPGVDGKDGETMTRIVYKDPDGKEHQGATLDDGLKFHGDSGDIVTRKLNTQLDMLGGQRHGAQPRSADLIDRPGRAFLWQSGLDMGLPRRVLPLTRSQNLAEDGF